MSGSPYAICIAGSQVAERLELTAAIEEADRLHAATPAKPVVYVYGADDGFPEYVAREPSSSWWDRIEEVFDVPAH